MSLLYTSMLLMYINFELNLVYVKSYREVSLLKKTWQCFFIINCVNRFRKTAREKVMEVELNLTCGACKCRRTVLHGCIIIIL